MKKLVYLLLIIILLFSFNEIYAITNKINVLVIEIDPTLTKGSIGGYSCKGLKASECIKQDSSAALNEIIEDLQYSSNSNVEINIVKKEYLNEFATYNTSIECLSGMCNRLDENTWLDIMKSGWYNSLSDSRVELLGSYKFDYEYIIEKYNLIERKNNNEFDEVWILNVDPASLYESIMVGKTAYWLNAPGIIKDCNNFKIMNVSISRRDVNLESFGHAAESILNSVFSPRYDSYKKSSLTNFNIDDLNLWERFTLNNYASPGYSCVGNIHFAPNSTKDYDWENSTYVNSSYKDFLNYPNITGQTVSVNSDTWGSYNNNLFSAARVHHRWWFKLMPHIEGRTSDGYSNNWWDYLVSNDFVTSITSTSKNKTYYVGDEINDISVKLNYKSGLIKNEIIDYSLDNVNIIENGTLLKRDNKIYASKSGANIIKYSYDGNSIEIRINIYDKISDVSGTEISTIEEENNINNLYIIAIAVFCLSVFIPLVLIKYKK